VTAFQKHLYRIKINVRIDVLSLFGVSNKKYLKLKKPAKKRIPHNIIVSYIEREETD
jgi:hypothetical protein